MAMAMAGARQECVRLLHLALRVEPFNHQSVHIADTQCVLDVRLLEQVKAAGRGRGWGEHERSRCRAARASRKVRVTVAVSKGARRGESEGGLTA